MKLRYAALAAAVVALCWYIAKKRQAARDRQETKKKFDEIVRHGDLNFEDLRYWDEGAS